MRFCFWLVFFAGAMTSMRCTVKLPKVNLYDSLSVRHFIHRSSLCESIGFVEKNKDAFCAEQGYSSQILASIVAGRNEQVFIPHYNNSNRVSSKQQEVYLQAQMDTLKKMLRYK